VDGTVRFYSIAMFIFVLNVSFAIVHNSSPFTSIYPNPVLPSYILPSPTIPPTYMPSSESLGATAFMTGDFFKSMYIMLSNFASAPVMLATYIRDLGFPDWLADMLRALFTFVYVVGIVQFLGNRMMKSAR
jgi:hypothetical protein